MKKNRAIVLKRKRGEPITKERGKAMEQSDFNKLYEKVGEVETVDCIEDFCEDHEGAKIKDLPDYVVFVDDGELYKRKK